MNLIVAFDKARIIGNNGKLPWHIKADMEHFRKRTIGCPVVMGRKTFMSIPDQFRPLPGRFNIVLSEGYGYPDLGKNIVIATNIVEAIRFATAYNYATRNNDIWIAGGATVYEHALREGVVDHVIATEVHGHHNGDTYFPQLPVEEWDKALVSSGQDYEIYRYDLRS